MPDRQPPRGHHPPHHLQHVEEQVADFIRQRTPDAVEHPELHARHNAGALAAEAEAYRQRLMDKLGPPPLPRPN